MYLLNSFSRKVGAKDKTKRKNRGLLGGISGLGIGSTAALLTNKNAINKKLAKEGLDTKGIKNKISQEIKTPASLYKNIYSPSRKFLEELDNIAPTGNLEEDLRRQISNRNTNTKELKEIGKKTANSIKAYRSTLKNEAASLKKTVGRNRVITGALLGLGAGVLAGKTLDFIKNRKWSNSLSKDKIRKKHKS